MKTFAAATRLTALVFLVTAFAGCGYLASRHLQGEEAPVPDDFVFVGDKSPCFLELVEGETALRVNCFHLDGVLHIHSSRWSKLPRISGESWIVTIRRTPQVRVEIADKIYEMRADPIEDEDLRLSILHNRGYWHAWDGIVVFRFTGRVLDTDQEPVRSTQPSASATIT